MNTYDREALLVGDEPVPRENKQDITHATDPLDAVETISAALRAWSVDVPGGEFGAGWDWKIESELAQHLGGVAPARNAVDDLATRVAEAITSCEQCAVAKFFSEQFSLDSDEALRLINMLKQDQL